MSTVFLDTDIDAISITLLSKADRVSTLTVYVGTEHYPTGAIYSSSPAVQPILLNAPAVKRSVGNEVGVRHDVTIALFGKAHLSDYGKGFVDLLESYELTNQEISIFYWSKPRDTTTTHTASVNTRQVLRGLEWGYDDQTGIVSIQARDYWFEDKTFTRELSGDMFPNIDPAWELETGGTVFGDYVTDYYNTTINAPFIDSGIDGSNRPNAKIFTGWTFPNHPNQARDALIVRNQTPSVDPAVWFPCRLVGDPQTAVYGDATFSQLAEPSNWETDLSRYWRSVVYTPTSTAGAEVLTAVQMRASVAPFFRCADIANDRWLECVDPVCSVGDETFSIEFWLYFDALNSGASETTIIGQGELDFEDWDVYFSTADAKLRFGIWNATSRVKTVATTSTLTTGTWYQVVCYHDAAANEIGIYVNNGGAATTATTGSAPAKYRGKFFIGKGPDATLGFDGGIKWFRMWRRKLTAGDGTALYNSGAGLHDDAFTDTLKKDLVVSFPLDEPKGKRFSFTGGKELAEMNGEIGYNGTSWAPTVDNSHGELVCEVYHVETNGPNSYTRKGGVLRRATLDVTTAAIVSGTSNAFFQFDDPLVMIKNKSYAIELHWTNVRTGARFVRCNYRSQAGFDHYRLDTRTDEANWEKQTDQQLGIALYVLGFGDDGDTVGTTSGDVRYSYTHIEAKSITLSTGQTRLEFDRALEFKVVNSGLTDDGSGTYTGSAGSVMTYPADIARFLLQHASIIGLSSGRIDSSSFSTVRTLQTSAALKVCTGLESDYSVRDLLVELCRQGRMILYKTRDGKLAVKYPVYAAASTFVNEARLRGDLLLISVDADDIGNVVNDFLQLYHVDPIDQPKDPAFLRKARTQKFYALRYISATGSTDSDPGRQEKCSASQALYGKGESRGFLDFYQTSGPVQSVQNYWCDRYTDRQTVVRFRVPRRLYYSTLDLFSVVRIEHTGIAHENGTFPVVGATDGSGSSVIIRTEGIDSEVWAGGQIEGEIIGIEEQGGYMVITARTWSAFNSL